MTTPYHDQQKPTPFGSFDAWGDKLNDLLDYYDGRITLTGPLEERPETAPENAEYRATDVRVRYAYAPEEDLADGDGWVAIGGLGSDGEPVPGTAHFSDVQASTAGVGTLEADTGSVSQLSSTSHETDTLTTQEQGAWFHMSEEQEVESDTDSILEFDDVVVDSFDWMDPDNHHLEIPTEYSYDFRIRVDFAANEGGGYYGSGSFGEGTYGGEGWATGDVVEISLGLISPDDEQFALFPATDAKVSFAEQSFFMPSMHIPNGYLQDAFEGYETVEVVVAVNQKSGYPQTVTATTSPGFFTFPTSFLQVIRL